MRDELLSTLDAQEMDTSGYQESDLDDQFYWENDQLDVDAVFRPGVATPFSSSTVNDFVMGSMVDNPIPMDEEQDKENSPHPPYSSTPISETPNQSLLIMRSRPFETALENVPDYVFRNMFEKFIYLLLCVYFKIHYNNRVSFNHDVFQKVFRHVVNQGRSSIVFIIFIRSRKFLSISGPYRQESDTP